MTSVQLGFPPGTSHIVLPGRNRRAARAGLTLYTALYPRQRFAVTAAELALRAGAGRLLQLKGPVELPDLEDWRAWLESVAEPLVGEVAHTAWLPQRDDRTCAVLLNDRGAPVAFLKLRPPSETDTVEPVIAEMLSRSQPRTFRTPQVLIDSEFQGRHARLLEPLPEGPHRRPPHRPRQLAALVDELQARLGDLPRPADSPPSWRPAHGDLTPRNVRLASDGRWWVYDWEYSAWAPRLADELRYWAADFAFRQRTRPVRDARRVLALLRRRGDDDEIDEALRWPRVSTSVEQTIRDELSTLLVSGRA